MEWDAPPEGFNVDTPGNYFELRDWDFTEFNNDLKHYIDDLKVNSVCLTHTNPRVSNLFKHLPGKALDDFDTQPPHATMAWQTFREHTFIVWGKRKSDPLFDETIEVTKKQWDRLVLDYYRAMVKNLAENGWLDKFYILVDETTNIKRISHFIKLLKSDPITRKLRIAHCMQSFESLNHMENGKYVFTHYCPVRSRITTTAYGFHPLDFGLLRPSTL